uniref:Secreted protein n=1 Tax=Hymenolepis diminuta TaxID=6216 RepID=A0A0R3SZ26_HYMDI
LNSRGRNSDGSRVESSSTDTGPCRYAICLTHAQLISVSVITILIILVPNCTAYEYVNWSSPMNTRNWGNQTSALQPLVISDTIQPNPVASIASSVYSKARLPNATYIRSPSNAISLFQNKCPGNPDSKCRSFQEVK